MPRHKSTSAQRKALSETEVAYSYAKVIRKDIYHAVDDRIRKLLAGDLSFHDASSNGGRHNFHSFPAKFPPQLPRLFIDYLTDPEDIVLDPMVGSGTTIIEATSAGRIGVGFDIDPLSILISKVKATSIDPAKVQTAALQVVQGAEISLLKTSRLEKEIEKRFDEKTKEFIDYWFSRETQTEIMALLIQIEKVDDGEVKDFLRLLLSSIIVTKSGGVSLAWDLGHTRPHKLNQGQQKKYKPAIQEFEKRLLRNLQSLRDGSKNGKGFVQFGSAENLPLKDDSIDLIVTSPPYASNAIDYMRAHKFSLVWLGMDVGYLSHLRSKYIGSDKVADYNFKEIPPATTKIISRISNLDRQKGKALHRYYNEMASVLCEMQRVLKPGKTAIVVVGSSIMRGIDTETDKCLVEIGESLDLHCAGIGVRSIDRNKRMLPTSSKVRLSSQIENRMHKEFVIAFTKQHRREKDG
ncbi:MAG: DNA methyltransferase [Candidatus Kryptoniota bacterium]